MSGDGAFTIEIRNRLLNPAEAEVWASARADGPTEGLSVRGRLLGPRCEYANTVEVAYPLRPLSGAPDALGATARVLIPEPSFWDPESPFLYAGPVTVWQDDRLRFETTVSHGLRHCQLGPRGLRWNGRPLTLRGVARQQLSREQAQTLRRAGCNTLLAAVREDAEALWAAADCYGFLMLGRVADDQAVRTALALKGHPSCLGWLLSEGLLRGESPHGTELLPLHNTHGHLLGAELHGAAPEQLLRGLQFVACPAGVLPDLAGLHWPKIVLAAEETWSGDAPEIFGQIQGA
jgi:hypothetical protein